MTRRNSHWVLSLAVGVIAAFAGKAFSATFTNPTPIAIPAPGSASDPLISTGTSISVLGLGAFTQSVTVEITGFSETLGGEGDVGLVLVGPTGAALVLQWRCGHGAPAATNINVGYSDAAASLLPNTGPIASGLYEPTQYDSFPLDLSFPSPGPGTAFRSPAPIGSSTLATVFGASNPNGTWSLYATDPVISDDVGEISGGWSLTVNAVSAPEPSTFVLGIAGLAGLGFVALRKKFRQA